MLFITAKPQNALAGGILALYVARVLPLGHGRVWRILTILGAAFLVLCAVVTYRGTSRIVRGSAMHIAVSSELLAHSPSPERDLNELRLPASLMKYVGTHPWQWSPPTFDDPEFVRTFLARMGMGRLALFYLHHPERLMPLFDRSAVDALATRAPLGNFEASTGAAPGALSERFGLWTNIKTALAPKTANGMLLVFGLLVLVAIAARVRAAPFDRPLVDLGIALVAIATTQFATVAMVGGTMDTAKQMCLFRAIADLLVVACVSAAAGLAAAHLVRTNRTA